MTVKLRHSTTLKLKATQPYSFSLTVHNPAGWWFLTPLEKFQNGTLWTVIRQGSANFLGLKLKSIGNVENPMVLCETFSREKLTAKQKKDVSDTITWMLNLREDIRDFYALAESDRLVRALVEDLYGMRQTKRTDIFPRLILALTLQMAPIKRSSQMMRLLIENYGEKIRFDGEEVTYWPSAKKIAKATVKELREKCKLGYRAELLRTIAESLTKGFPTVRELEKMPPEKAKAKLMELKGIGEYSADIISPHPGFALDVWSAKIFHLLLFGKEPENPRKVIPKLKDLAERRWGKWRGYVFTYVLNDLKNLSKRFNLNLTEP